MNLYKAIKEALDELQSINWDGRYTPMFNSMRQDEIRIVSKPWWLFSPNSSTTWNSSTIYLSKNWENLNVHKRAANLAHEYAHILQYRRGGINKLKYAFDKRYKLEIEKEAEKENVIYNVRKNLPMIVPFNPYLGIIYKELGIPNPAPNYLVHAYVAAWEIVEESAGNRDDFLNAWEEYRYIAIENEKIRKEKENG